MANITLEEQGNWATSLLESLGDDTTSSNSVVGWLQSNLGLLNSYIGTSFTVDGDEIVEHMQPIQSGLYNEMYICYWLRRKSNSLLNNADYDWVEMRGEKQGSVKRISKNERSKTIASMAKECDLNFKNLLKDLKGGRAGSFLAPRSLSFNERFSTPEHVRCRDYYGWSESNPITTTDSSSSEL